MSIHIDTNLMFTIALGILIGFLLWAIARWVKGKL